MQIYSYFRDTFVAIMKTFILSLLAYLFTNTLLAQEDTTFTKSHWIKGVSVGLNFNAIGLRNWSQGGDPSVSSALNFKSFIHYDNKRYFTDNDFNIDFGQIYLPSEEYFPLRKTDDQFILSHQQGYNFDTSWSVLGNIRIQSQFAPGYGFNSDSNNVVHRTLKSSFLSPGYMISGLGFQYKYAKKIRMSAMPATYKLTAVMDDVLAKSGVYGNDTSKSFRHEIGWSFKLWFKFELFKNAFLENDLLLFSDYATLGEVDVNWTTQLTLSVNNWLKVTAATNLIYDDDINLTRDDGSVGPETQFKHTYGIGLIFSFGSKKPKKD